MTKGLTFIYGIIFSCKEIPPWAKSSFPPFVLNSAIPLAKSKLHESKTYVDLIDDKKLF